MIWSLLGSVILLLAAITANAISKRITSRSGLPAGRLIYSDTGFATGKIGPVARDETGQKQESPLISEKYGLIGRPDYLVETDEGIIPVEAKSARLPSNGQPFDSHVFQLVAYCLLVEDVLGSDVPYGVLRYRDREVQIEYTRELRAELLDLLDEMRKARKMAEVHRDHDDARRCANCYLRDACDEAL